jgi:hypothetical protein
MNENRNTRNEYLHEERYPEIKTVEWKARTSTLDIYRATSIRVDA